MRGKIAFAPLRTGPRVNQSHSHPLYSVEVHPLPLELWAELIRAQSTAPIGLKNDPAARERLCCDPRMRRKSIARSRLSLPTILPWKLESSCRVGRGRLPLKSKWAEGSAGKATRRC